jgi:hypothetical protein
MNFNKEKIKSYLIEFSIVTIGVLIALFLSNIKENNQARKYEKAVIETINNEINSNYSSLKSVVDNHINILDTLNKYADDSSSIVNIFKKTGGVNYATIHNSSLELYKRNQISSIDFKMMSTLTNMNYVSEMIDNKLNKLSEYVYSNALNNSKESKEVVILHLRDVLNSENQLLEYYKDYIEHKE